MGITGIDIGNSSISLAAFERGRLTQLVREDLPPELAGAGRVTNHEAMAEFLRALRRRHPGLPKRAALVLQPAEALTRRLQMPAMTEAQLRLNLPFEFRDYIPQDADRYFYDFAVLGQEAAPDGSAEPAGAAGQVAKGQQGVPAGDFSRDASSAQLSQGEADETAGLRWKSRAVEPQPQWGTTSQGSVPGEDAPSEADTAAGQLDLMACAAMKRVIEDHQAMFSRAGMRLVAAMPTPSALQNIANAYTARGAQVVPAAGSGGRQSHEWDTQAQAQGGRAAGGAFATSFCVIDFGTQTTKLRFFARGLYDVTRQIEVGGADVDRAIAGAFGVDEATARRYKLEDFEGAQTCLAARAVYEQIAVEVARAVTFYQFSNADVQLELAFCAGAGQALEPLLEAVRAQTSLELAPFEALDGLRGQDPQLHAACFAAIGVALGADGARARAHGAAAAVAVADKRAINLAQTDARPGSAAAHVALFAALIILVALFAKFLVMAPLSTAAESAQDVAAAQAQLAALEEANANYAEVAQDYARHVVDNLTDAEAALQDRNQVVDLVQQLLLPVGQVTALAVSDNTITATLTDASMATVSDAVRTLQADARVSYVTVSTAKGTQGSQSDATTTLLEVTLVDGALAASQGAEG